MLEISTDALSTITRPYIIQNLPATGTSSCKRTFDNERKPRRLSLLDSAISAIARMACSVNCRSTPSTANSLRHSL